MKIHTLPFLLLFLNLSCNAGDSTGMENKNESLAAKEILNVTYGSHKDQKMDVYLPAGRDENTKVFILVHGGGWSGGSKADFNYVVPMLKSQFPDYAIVNMDYRLATPDSPAFPKQIQDIEKVVQYLKDSNYTISSDYAFIGASAGAHLAMLYSYKHDPQHNVKAVCSIVGPSDFTDPAYTQHPMFQYGAVYLIGNVDYRSNPEIAIGVSPALHVSAKSPATILFYGGQDPLIPVSQATRLKEKLDANNVYNEYYLYANGGHGNWNTQTMADFQEKMIRFFKERF